VIGNKRRKRSGREWTWGWTDEKWTTFDVTALESAEARRLTTLVDRSLAPGPTFEDRDAPRQMLLRYQKVGVNSIAQMESGKRPDQDWIAKRNANAGVRGPNDG